MFIIIRLRSLVAVVVFGAGVWIGYNVSETWLVSWFENRLVILSDPLLPPYSVIAEPGTTRNTTKTPRILCMVLSLLRGSRAQIVYETWGQRCDSIFFITSRPLPGLPTIVVPPNINESRDSLWQKVMYGLSSAYSNYYDKADWFLKADDDTYVIIDNLRSLVAHYNTAEPMYFGCRFAQGYMSGGAGYVMSKKALEMFIAATDFGSKIECHEGRTTSEDVNMGLCFESMEVKAIDTRDIFGRERFLVIVPFKEGVFVPGHIKDDFWYWTSMYYPVSDWFDCCAESAITFHYAEPTDMVIIDFFLYHLSPYLRL